MNITRDGVQRMIVVITAAENFGTLGHESSDYASALVGRLGRALNTVPAELHIPDALLSELDGSTLGDIVAGYGRPLGYLCSDCRYPKWLLTPEEATAQHRSGGVLRPDGFTQFTPECPRCGD